MKVEIDIVEVFEKRRVIESALVVAGDSYHIRNLRQVRDLFDKILKEAGLYDRVYEITWGDAQYPHIEDQYISEDNKFEFYNEDNGFDHDIQTQMVALNVGEEFDCLGSLYDIKLKRVK